MILSMTGFGRASNQLEGKTITVEIKSLNSKITDIKLRLAQRFKEKEMDIRSLILEQAQRGKIEINLDLTTEEGGTGYSINQSLFKAYYKDLIALSKELNIPSGDYISGILRIQGVVDVPKNGISDKEWNLVKDTIVKALQQLKEFRLSEGNAMEKDLRERIANISKFLLDIAPFEHQRIDKIKQRILQNLSEHVGKDNVDQNRFEQELIYYLEKFDLNEEKVRLKQHCEYFIEQLNSKKTQKGRKLTFIGQEMGREINTLGSKAYSSDIQHIVVKMKDELEKIKEQAANIL